MKCTLKIATVVLMLGTTVATAQTPTQAHPFVERYLQMESLNTGKPVCEAPAGVP